MSIKAVIDIARADLNYTESPPNSNKTKYGEWFGMNWQPWCVMALAYWFDKAGERMAFFGGGKTASCSTLLMWYQNIEQTVPVSEVQPGDIVLLNFNGKGTADHCGLVVETHWHQDASLDWIETIEGNTTASAYGSQDNGGCVSQKRRYPGQVVAVCRPQYKKEEPEIMDDITGHWAEREIWRCIRLGLIKGYPDGTFAPEKPVTRAELAAVVDRLTNLIIGDDDLK